MMVIKSIIENIPYELLKDRKQNISYLHIFGSKFFILNNGEHKLDKFNAILDEVILIGYSSSGNIYSGLNNRTFTIEYSMHATFDETKPQEARKCISFSLNVSGLMMEFLVKD